MTTDKAELPGRACQLVGGFLYYFGRVEAQLDEGIRKLFNLDAAQAAIITSNIDVVKKANIVETAADLQAKAGAPVSVDIEKTFGAVRGINYPPRVIVAHSPFEEAEDGVQFKRIVAKGELKVEHPHWKEAVFGKHYETLQRLEGELKRMIRELDPNSIDWSVFPVFGSSYPPEVWLRPAGLTDAVRSTTEGKRETPTPAREGD